MQRRGSIRVAFGGPGRIRRSSAFGQRQQARHDQVVDAGRIADGLSEQYRFQAAHVALAVVDQANLANACGIARMLEHVEGDKVVEGAPS